MKIAEKIKNSRFGLNENIEKKNNENQERKTESDGRSKGLKRIFGGKLLSGLVGRFIKPYIVGLFFYVFFPLAMYYFDAGHEMLMQGLDLAFEITVLIIVFYFYPLIIFLAGFIFKSANFSNLAYFQKQTILASNIAVSLGLIGTFIGLTDMIIGIAAGMGADGDMAEKMNALMAAISSALDAMAFAFLTSIFGVGGSVAILFSSNFLDTFFEEKERKEKELSSSATNSSLVENAGIMSLANDIDDESIRGDIDRLNNQILLMSNYFEENEKRWTEISSILKNVKESEVLQKIFQSVENNEKIGMLLIEEQAITSNSALLEKINENRDILNELIEMSEKSGRISSYKEKDNSNFLKYFFFTSFIVVSIMFLIMVFGENKLLINNDLNQDIASQKIIKDNLNLSESENINEIMRSSQRIFLNVKEHGGWVDYVKKNNERKSLEWVAYFPKSVKDLDSALNGLGVLSIQEEGDYLIVKGDFSWN